MFEDETSGESRFRRAQTGVPPPGRVRIGGPGMPLEMRDPEDEVFPRSGSSRFGAERPGEPAGPWWRPAGTFGRALLGCGVLLVAGACVAGFLAARTYLVRDSRFRIAGTGNIDASGLTEVSRAEMLPVFGEDIGKNIFFVHLDERRKQLEQIPWVERATVMRLLPDRIRVSVVERQPVAFVRQGQQVELVDKQGVLLTMPAAMMAQHHYSFPVVTGIDPQDPLPARQARMAVYERLVGELDAHNQHLSEQISEIDLTDPQDARILLPEQGADILGHFGDDRFLDRYQRYKAHIAEWRQQYPKLTAVDLRYDNQVVLEMAPGTDAVAAAVGDGGVTTQGTAPAKPAAGAAPPSGAAAALGPASDTAPAKPMPGKPSPSQQAAIDPSPERQAVLKPAETPQAKAVPARTAQARTPESKTGRTKPVSAEALAARQRKARAARARAAHERAEREKKRAAQQHARVANPKAVSPARAGASAAQGQ